MQPWWAHGNGLALHLPNTGNELVRNSLQQTPQQSTCTFSWDALIHFCGPTAIYTSSALFQGKSIKRKLQAAEYNTTILSQVIFPQVHNAASYNNWHYITTTDTLGLVWNKSTFLIVWTWFIQKQTRPMSKRFSHVHASMKNNSTLA